MKQNLTAFLTHAKGSMRDLAPIVIVILFFQFSSSSSLYNRYRTACSALLWASLSLSSA
jgi:hypothetical protein